MPSVLNGSRVARFHESNLPGSAWDVLEPILTNTAGAVALRIQRELVDLGRLIPETDAGNALRASLKDLADMHKKNIEFLKGNLGMDEQRQRLKETEKQVHQLSKQIHELRVPFGMRVKSWFGLR
ncbi:uncharacterized protein F5891DRAFT_1013243 [Suillus fuscotomentosus]|uniref:Uncharacterized protein n=1 Tax=Suillus fuscotomentosus TaxID=1912939 RepID=A0AAD4EDI8_9AGAM|nr:uncharacterized protein F5891DRAFT_1013243 [Suillus fuscotomentosus]KAG1904147.1 hypothetical protein F5891DRAFT_1013243 [Suillus fuscotomentosus]